jgi:hypothetical protein
MSNRAKCAEVTTCEVLLVIRAVSGRPQEAICKAARQGS